MNGTYTDWFDIRSGDRRGCVVSPWLVMNGCPHNLKNSGIRMDELSVKCLLYADDQVILVVSACDLQAIVTKINVFVNRRGESVQWRCDLCLVCADSLQDTCRNSNIREWCGLKDVLCRVEM
ncbi:hypothetical protein EVAR_68783_1 [Eumeta japonica]|uniref:Reverse transcriptase domain-containing protein n=1 Tax=Eumeta variegata TaxID=151549 RepID=A0A4C1Z5I1_EUMVA|nr:hypothetical protein EVAR_68783_1 [Eumeta japonica]